VGHIRAAVREEAMTVISTQYDLPKRGTEEAIERVNELLQDYSYSLFDPDAEVPKVVHRFQHPAIASIIAKVFFNKSASVWSRNPGLFAASAGFPEFEKEVPVPMIALAAASIHFALTEWKTPEDTPVAEFASTEVVTAYRTHIALLERLRLQAPKKLHSLSFGLVLSALTAGSGDVTTHFLESLEWDDVNDDDDDDDDDAVINREIGN